MIELLVAMVILAILSTLSFGVYNNAQTRSRDSKRKNDVEQTGRALELYFNDFGKYPNENSGEIGGAGWGSSFEASGEIYMKLLPEDSKSPAYEYRYDVSSDNQKYRVSAKLERDDDPDLDSGLEGKEIKCGTADEAICNFGISSTNASLTDSAFD